eukprot:6209638-Pleurochrysis_carterae.AAC.2
MPFRATSSASQDHAFLSITSPTSTPQADNVLNSLPRLKYSQKGSGTMRKSTESMLGQIRHITITITFT